MKERSKFFAILGTLALVLMVWGCGTDSPPVAPEQATITQAPDGRVFVTFSESATLRAGKLAAIPPEGTGATKTFPPSGTDLQIEEYNGDGADDDLRVTFRTFNGALNDNVDISMTVYGNTLSELVVAFGPSGLNFLVEAQLEMVLGVSLVDLDLNALIAWHIHDGITEQASMSVENLGGGARVLVGVPGFSRYSLGP